ncbi:restriction endonuclease subunit S [Anaerococcus tetradius]|uniref:Type I restriction modification DNA specificity domain protein n=1 Tax=Anaerococcus tetradius ATCC 35098 TaxID=525255 RepID=C2CF25_9FIRM|nr:restriction endonuclease subunit S [Anaerococcus tetradius]EEI83829.1 type I restriction modification DNA specificity domain protein [Anaerococcus tetradius ATCC 35098]
MTPQELKNSILQRAIEGKLVEQRKEEGTGEELYKLIQEEKNKLIKEGKVKKQKPLPEITEEEIPFDIPESWKWVRLGDVFQFINGDRGKNYPAKSKLKENGDIPFISAINLKDGTVDENNLLYLDINQYERLGSGKLLKNDIVLCIRGSLGKNCIYPFEKGAIASSLVILRNYKKIKLEFVLNYLNSYLFYSETKKYDNGTAQPNLSAQNAKKILLPLPPLKEQERIVEKIEDLMLLVDKYGKNWQMLEDLNKKFPEDLKKSLLQEAIKGRLVEQRKEEGTGEELFELIKEEKNKLIKEGKIKKQKPLPEITEEEIPFDIPESWKWVRLGEITLKLTDGAHKTPTYTNEGIPFLSVKDISSGKIDYSSCRFISKKEHDKLFERCNPERGDLLLTKVGTTGIPVVIDTDEEFSLFVSVALLKFPKKLINIYFLKHLINSPLVQVQVKENTRGVGNKNWVMRDIANTIIPLPPLAEQKRLVEKLEELLPLCEQVIKN